jgi:membrane-associated two-gene conflict system component 1 (EACC1)
MNVEISISDADQHPRTLKNLQDWLLNEPALLDCRVSRPPAIPEPGQMGAVSEVLVVALGSGGSGAALAGSLSVWLSTRVNDMTLKIRTQKGEVNFHARSTKDAKELIEAITPLISETDA